MPMKNQRPVRETGNALSKNTQFMEGKQSLEVRGAPCGAEHNSETHGRPGEGSCPHLLPIRPVWDKMTTEASSPGRVWARIWDTQGSGRKKLTPSASLSSQYPVMDSAHIFCVLATWPAQSGLPGYQTTQRRRKVSPRGRALS